MPYTAQGLPFAADSHTSYKAAVSVAPGRRNATRAYLDALEEAGMHGLTDHEASERIGRPIQSICSIRNGAANCELVTKAGERPGPYGKDVTVWRYVHH
jgi:hypothetical protein